MGGLKPGALLLLALLTPARADPIHSYVMKSEPQAILSELARGVSINQADHNGETPLHWAVRHDRPEMIRFLLDHGAAPDMPDPNGHAPLYHADKLKLADPLLDRGANPSRLDHTGATPLHQMCLYGRTDVVDRMIKAGGNVNLASRYGDTPLLRACHFGSTEVIDLLLGQGASLQVRDGQGFTPLQLAARCGSLAAVRRLVAAGAESSEPQTFALAVQSGQPDLVDYLGTRVRPTREALLSAIAWGRPALFQALLARGGQVQGEIVRQAAAGPEVAILSWLLDRGENVESTDLEGVTALMCAAAAHRRPAIELLLARGAQPEQQDHHGRRAADYLCEAIKFQEAYISRKSRSRAAFTDDARAQAELEARRETLQLLRKL